MKTFVTSDIHFFHHDILKFCPESRPFNDVEEMNSEIISRWNSLISNEDETWILGDITLGSASKTAELLEQLNGTKHLITGNHDDKALRDKSFREQFSSIQNYKDLKYQGHFIVLFHYPIFEWRNSHYGSYHFFGHTHNKPIGLAGRCKDVGLDSNNCYPFLIDDLIEEMKLVQYDNRKGL